jgi:hypothetical protein
MRTRIQKAAVRWLGAALVALMLLVGTPVQAVEPPGGGIIECTFDVLFMRPMSIAATVAGSVVFALSYPLTRLAGGEPALEALVQAPFDDAFRRKLGTW